MKPIVQCAIETSVGVLAAAIGLPNYVKMEIEQLESSIISGKVFLKFSAPEGSITVEEIRELLIPKSGNMLSPTWTSGITEGTTPSL